MSDELDRTTEDFEGHRLTTDPTDRNTDRNTDRLVEHDDSDAGDDFEAHRFVERTTDRNTD